MKLYPALLALSRAASVSASETGLYSPGDGFQQDRSLVLSKEKSATPEDPGAYRKQRLAMAALVKAISRVSSSKKRNDPIVIPVCFHVITDLSFANEVTDSELQAQLNALNKAFSSASCCDFDLEWCNVDPSSCSIETDISFRMAELNDARTDTTQNTVDSVTSDGACVTRTTNNAWGDLELFSEAETAMKSTLHMGDAKTANVYFTDIQGFLSVSTYPWQLEDSMEMLDGIIVDYNTVPGSAHPYFNEGDVLVHELGHWLGLLSTFAGGCGISDGVADTPKAAGPYYGCSPPAPDSCPDDGQGADPIFNFMDWSNDACIYQFTRGQSDLMHASWSYFRVGDITVDTIDLVLGESSDPVLLVPNETVYFKAETTFCSMICVSSASEGDAEMFLAFDMPPLMDPDLDLCASTTEGSIESCSFTEDDAALGTSFFYDTFPFSLLPRFCETFPFRWICDIANDLNPFGHGGQQDTDPGSDGLCSPGLRNDLYVGMKTLSNSSVPDLRVRCESR